jgi:hypothetical protein
MLHFTSLKTDPCEVSPEALAASLRVISDFVRMDQPLGDTDADAGVFAAHQAIYGYITAIADDLDGTQ